VIEVDNQSPLFVEQIESAEEVFLVGLGYETPGG